jgi:ELWxxDGT repeat protein
MNPPKIPFGILCSLRVGLAGIISLAFLLSASATSQATVTQKPVSSTPNLHILQDINQEPMFAIGYRFFSFGGNLFFDIPANNCQVWRSNGSTAGTELFLEFTYGSGNNGNCLDPYLAGDLFYFQNRDPDHGNELWVSDGTQAGTHLLKDINPGPEGIGLWNPFPLGDKLFFFAGDSSDKMTFWVTDGSRDGTVALYSGIPTFEDFPFFPLYDVQGLVYFFGNDPAHGR